MANAKAMLDEQYPAPPQPKSDDNNYAVGKIRAHKVVIACLPTGRAGTTSAAVVATQMLSTFTGIRFGLMVGVGGGVPSEEMMFGWVMLSSASLQTRSGESYSMTMEKLC